MLLLLSVALAWETHVDAAAPWSSLDVPAGQPLNEHERLLETALRSIDTSWSLKIGAGSVDDDRALLLDFNTTWTRRGEVPTFDPRPQTLVQERRVPRMTTMAGLPDVSFTVLDWANRNTYCPAIPVDGRARNLCHDYGGWLGAGLNATHFGDLATKMYDRHHRIAVREAGNAKEIHDVLARGGLLFDLADGSDWHADKVHEAERLALMYEATGQHYLQDRLAVGHMFSRWGSGEYSDWLGVVDDDPLRHAQAVGLTAAVTHGSFAATEFPDGLNFPMEGVPAQWRYVTPGTFGVNGVVDGIGDDLEGALVAGTTANGIGAYLIQRELMTTCTAGGLRQVAAQFHTNSDGTYGTDRVSLTALGPEEDPAVATLLGFDPAAEPACTDAWVTNESYYRGAEFPTATQAMSKLVVKLTGKPELGTLPDAQGFVRVGKGLVANRAKAWVNMIRDPSGVESAKDGLTFDAGGFFVPNHRYDVPSWVEPEQLSTLPAEDDEGQDLRTLDGLFVHAHPNRTCASVFEVLEELRTVASDAEHPDRDRATATCAAYAELVYKGTEPDYDGVYQEHVAEWLDEVEAADTDAWEPYCAYFDGPEIIVPIRNADAREDGRPYYVHPGYVSAAGSRMASDDGFQTLANWCQKAPVLDTDDDDRAGSLDRLDADRFVTLTGRNLGFRTTNGETGTVSMQDGDGNWQPIEVWDAATGTVGGWGDTFELDIRMPLASEGFPSLAIQGMSPPEIMDLPPATYALQVERASDPFATAIFLADGAQSPHPVVVDVATSWIELELAPLPSDATEAGFWVVRPDAYQDDLERLVLGFFQREADGTYTPLAIPFTERDDEFPNDGSPISWTPLPDLLGIHVDLAGNGLDPSIFDGDVVLFYAYH